MHRSILAIGIVALLAGCTKGVSEYNEGVKALQAKNYEEAKTKFEKAIAANPDIAEAWYNLGASKVYLAKKAADADKKEEALKLFRSGIEDKKKALQLMKQGKFVAYSEKGEQDRLIKECEDALAKIEPQLSSDDGLYLLIKLVNLE